MGNPASRKTYWGPFTSLQPSEAFRRLSSCSRSFGMEPAAYLSAVKRSAYWASPSDPWSNAKIIFAHLVMYCDTACLDNTNILFKYLVHRDPCLPHFSLYLPIRRTPLSDVNVVLVSGSMVSVRDRVSLPHSRFLNVTQRKNGREGD